MSDQTRLLLDKSVVRRYFEGVSGLARGQVQTEEEQQAIVLIHLARRKGQQLFLPIEAFNLLQAHRHQIAPAETVMFLERVEVLYHGRYFKRWARRLREQTFTREDAKVLALGTFGTDEAGQILGVHTVVTYDGPMLRKWDQDRERIVQRLQDMTSNLQAPFARAKLPDSQVSETTMSGATESPRNATGLDWCPALFSRPGIAPGGMHSLVGVYHD